MPESWLHEAKAGCGFLPMSDLDQNSDLTGVQFFRPWAEFRPWGGWSGWSLRSVQNPMRNQDGGGGYTRNHLAHRNGSPIKIYRISQGIEWKYFLHCISITNHSDFHINIKYMLCREVFFPIIPSWPRFSARRTAGQLDPWTRQKVFCGNILSWLDPNLLFNWFAIPMY